MMPAIDVQKSRSDLHKSIKEVMDNVSRPSLELITRMLESRIAYEQAKMIAGAKDDLPSAQTRIVLLIELMDEISEKKHLQLAQFSA